MKLQKQLSRKVEKKTYYKYIMIIPNKMVKSLGWKAGIELSVALKGKKMIIEERLV